jgi:hypothetical protein
MALMSAELYDALLEAGASEEKARKAAEAVAAYDNRFAALDTRLATIGGELAWLKWMVGTNIVLTLGVLWRLLK